MSDEVNVGDAAAEPEDSLPAKPAESEKPAKPGAPAAASQRLIVLVVLVALYWVAYLALLLPDMPSLRRFLWQAGALGLMALPYTVWWLAFYRGMRFRQRLTVFGAMILFCAAGVAALDRSVLPPVPILMTLPWLFTLGTLWLLAARGLPANMRMYGLILLAAIGWTPMTLIRMEGMSGEGVSALHWRWSRSAEDRYLAQQRQAQAESKPIKLEAPLELSPQDWPGFRGPKRDSALYGVKIATDWQAAPPKEIWRRRIGPGWSSFAVVAGRLFTQDQRGENEAVAAYDADTGQEIWVHQDGERFEEQMGGPGPRATPTFAEGRLYTLGAKGTLNCLDAQTGNCLWSRDIAKDAAGPDGKPQVPMWAYASSPLVADGLVYVFAGSSKSDKNLLAYRADDGLPAWTAKAGTHSYSSPQLATIAGKKQILFVSDQAASGFDPATGKLLWTHKAANPGGYSSIQPNFVTPSQFVYSFSQESGIGLLEVSQDSGGAWKAELKWETRVMNPFFNDLVVHDGALYGFDNEIFCCIDAATGKRNWKGGRYKTGQVLLLADQPLLLVTGEWGEVVLLAADPARHRELARIQAFDGKTWNHPVLAGNRLYLRNAEEMACYELKPFE